MKTFHCKHCPTAMEASDMENSECQSTQAWIEQEAADQGRTPVQTLGTGKIDSITYTVVHDLEDKTTFLHGQLSISDHRPDF
jgi:hypothetical protein